jgi:hypothetical protein
MCRILSGVDATPDRILHIRSPQKPSPLEPHAHRTSPTQNAAPKQPDIQLCFSHLCTTSTLWPEDGQARPKHVVTIAAINTIPRQLCFWRTLLLSFNVLVASRVRIRQRWVRRLTPWTFYIRERSFCTHWLQSSIGPNLQIGHKVEDEFLALSGFNLVSSTLNQSLQWLSYPGSDLSLYLTYNWNSQQAIIFESKCLFYLGCILASRMAQWTCSGEHLR